MEEMKNCKRCGRLHQSNGFSNVCNYCHAQDEADFGKIREYLYEHPFAKIFEVSTSLDISVHKIKRYLREGRLEIVEKTNLFLDCEMCGKPICSGRYCDECFKKVSHDFKVIYNPQSVKAKNHQINFKSSNDLKLRKVASK